MIRKGRTFCGVDAVIDKDLCSAKLAEEVGVDIFVIATDVEGAALHYGEPNQRILRSVTCEEAARYLEEGHFHPGSMGPKIETAIAFLEHAGNSDARVIICGLEHMADALAGTGGTRIERDPPDS